jgi:hypothetical protein
MASILLLSTLGNSMDVAELSARTGLLARKLRYVLDHRLLPGQRTATTGHGVPRTFTRFEGFALAVAAALLDAGLTRKVVAAALAIACDPVDGAAPDSAPLSAAFAAGGGRLEVGDGRHVRLTAPRRPGVQGAVDTGWRAGGRAIQVRANYTPVVRVAMDLAELAQAVQPRPGESD